MKTLKVSVVCLATYTSEIQVPDNLTLGEAVEYAEEHIDDISITDLYWIDDTDIDKENCYFKKGDE